MKTSHLWITGAVVVVFVAGIVSQGGSSGTPRSGGNIYGVATMLSDAWPTSPQPAMPQLPTPRVHAPRAPRWHVSVPAWVKRWEDPLDRAITPNGLPVAPSTPSSSGTSSQTAASSANASAMAKRRSATYRKPATALAMIQTKCLRGEMLASTCQQDGFPGGR